MLKIGSEAPDFILPDAQGNDVTLSDYAGKWVLLFFYPRDFSAVCTRQACSFRDHAREFARRGVELLGISLQRPETHRKFRDAHGLTFPLLWDRYGHIARKYRVMGFMGLYCRRSYVLVNPDMLVAHMRVEPLSFLSRRVEDLLEEIARCQADGAAISPVDDDD
jgi:peroxiredoxin Q/BCP